MTYRTVAEVEDVMGGRLPPEQIQNALIAIFTALSEKRNVRLTYSTGRESAACVVDVDTVAASGKRIVLQRNKFTHPTFPAEGIEYYSVKIEVGVSPEERWSAEKTRAFASELAVGDSLCFRLRSIDGDEKTLQGNVALVDLTEGKEKFRLSVGEAIVTLPGSQLGNWSIIDVQRVAKFKTKAEIEAEEAEAAKKRSPTPDVDAIEQATAIGLIDTALGDLQELANDIEKMSCYAIRYSHLSGWVEKIRRAATTVKSNVSKPGVTNMMTFGSDDEGEEHEFLSYGLVSTSVEPKHSGDGGGATSSNAGSNARKRSQIRIEDPRFVGSNQVVVPSTNLQTITPFVSGALYLLLDSLQATVNAEWCTCFLTSARLDGELVLASSVGSRQDRPGSLRLSGGIESQVLTSGIAVNVSHAYAEDEFTGAQDRGHSKRTRSEIVFPIMKPDTTGTVLGVIQACNKNRGKDTFSIEDENRAAECGHYIGCILSRYPCEITTSTTFDIGLLNNALFSQHKDKSFAEKFPLIFSKANRIPVQVFRTARSGHITKQEIARTMPIVPSITEAVHQISKVNDGWKNAVLLNIELEKEITRLRESTRVSKRENERLHAQLGDTKRQLETTENALEQQRAVQQRKFSMTTSSMPSSPLNAAAVVGHQ